MNENVKIKFAEILQENRTFFLPYLFYLAAGLLLMIAVPRGEILLFLNKNRTEFLDYFFKYSTYLGDGLYIFLAAVLFTLLRLRLALLTFLTFALSGIFVQIVKHIAVIPRPKSYFPSGVLFFIEGVKVYSTNSFPSGHTAAAFAFFLMLTFFLKNKAWGFLFFLLAVSTAFSRIYLLQHFFIDTYFGSMAGVMFTVFIYYYLRNNAKLRESKALSVPVWKLWEKKK